MARCSALNPTFVDGLFELWAWPEVAERSAGAQVPADRARVEGVDRVRAELRLDVAADLVQVDAEGAQQRGRVEARPVAAAGADDEPDRVAGSLGGKTVLGEQPRGFGCLREGEADQQVFQADVAVPGEFGLAAGRGQDRADRSRRPRCGRWPAPADRGRRPGSRRVAYFLCTDCRVTPRAAAMRSQVQPWARAEETCNASSWSSSCRSATTAANPIAGSPCAAAAASWVASLILSVWLAAQLDAGRVFASDLPDLGSGLNELNAVYRRRQPTRRLHS